MSIAGMIAVRGSNVTVRRATETEAADASPRLAWTSVGSGVRLTMEVMTAALAQRVWGEERQAEFHGRGVPGVDIIERDGIIVADGDHAGKHFRVVGARPFAMGSGSAHTELALQLTSETFA